MAVYLVGAGPGYSDLITVRGLNVLRRADIVVFDALANSDLLDECPNAEKIDVGKRCGDHKMRQDDINKLLVDVSADGKTVVRLKGGDPFLFGRGAEEAAELKKAGREVHVIPGVSSSIAVPELAGIPVTHRDSSQSVTIVTGHRREGEEYADQWKRIASAGGTIVILMGMTNAAAISEELIAGGLSPDTAAAIITDGAGDSQRTETTDLRRLGETVIEKGLSAPGIIVIGGVVKERSVLGDLN
ncbi:MAG: uroporphyrinogen-III C-methyltransferase [Candidatus Methanoplasma sp.]|jgi:uroporphyrin-III C-methyltransferase|nr:uroporphyrinogen-III C-methyltransferase [Candidatus Methanoplasma sp.]